MRKPNDLSRSLTVLKGDSTVIAVIEMSLSRAGSSPVLCLASSANR